MHLVPVKKIEYNSNRAGFSALKGLLEALTAVLLCAVLLQVCGCMTAGDYRKEADKIAYDIITQKQIEALGTSEPFTIVRHSQLFRRKLIESQDIQITGPWSLGTDKLEKPAHWPDDQPDTEDPLDPIVVLEENIPVKLTLLDALQIGARNSFNYQTNKENVFKTALNLDLARYDFDHIFGQSIRSTLSGNQNGSAATSTSVRNQATTSWDKRMANGMNYSAGLVVDLIELLTLNSASAVGIKIDASVSVPLMSGSGEHIVTEGLTQAEREVVYSIRDFEEFKRGFAVDVATRYLGVLRSMDQVTNAEASYKRFILSARTSRRLADAEKLTAIDVGQAIQAELGARDSWISARQSYQSNLDSFKQFLGLPVDANIELDREELTRLTENVKSAIIVEDAGAEDANDIVPADAPIVLEEPSMEYAGKFEMEPSLAIQLAFENRLDLRNSQDKVYDAQRKVVVAADALGTDLTLGASGIVGTDASLDRNNQGIRGDSFSGNTFLLLDLPIERTRESISYRNSLISLEQAVRNVAAQEDSIKLEIRNELRDLLSRREGLQTSNKGVQVAEERVHSANLFLQAGRSEIRNILEAQNDLLRAQNSLTSAVVNYRIAELQLQRDMGLLKVNNKGLWTEYSPGEIK